MSVGGKDGKRRVAGSMGFEIVPEEEVAEGNHSRLPSSEPCGTSPEVGRTCGTPRCGRLLAKWTPGNF